MKFRIFIFILFLKASTGVSAQNIWCDQRHHTTHEGYEQLNENIRAYLSQHPVSFRTERWLPVVVHVVTNDPEAVTYARIAHQIDILNRDFALQSENISRLNPDFESIVADTEIRFCLADKDPEGNTTDGVTRTLTNIQDIALLRDVSGRYVLHYDELGGKSGWDPDRYINIWVAEFGNELIGFGSAPGAAQFAEESGVVIDPGYFGYHGLLNDPVAYSKGHTLTHEMGHFLGLLHIWGGSDDSCTDSDIVEDTPNAEGPYLGCPEGDQMSCGVSNMYQNFMDFTDDRCLAAFTAGQAMRMNAVIDLYYPEMPMTSPCVVTANSPEQWWDSIVWTYDAGARLAVLYHPTEMADEFNIDVFAADGKLIKNDLIDQQTFLIDFSGLPSGIYFIRISSGKHYHVRKIVVY